MRRNVTQEFIDQFRIENLEIQYPRLKNFEMLHKFNLHLCEMHPEKSKNRIVISHESVRKRGKWQSARLRFAIRHTCSNTFSRGYLAETRRKWNESALQMCTLYLPRRNDIGGGGRAASAHGDTRVAIMSGPTSTCRPTSDAYLHRAHLDFPR